MTADAPRSTTSPAQLGVPVANETGLPAATTAPPAPSARSATEMTAISEPAMARHRARVLPRLSSDPPDTWT